MLATGWIIICDGTVPRWCEYNTVLFVFPVFFDAQFLDLYSGILFFFLFCPPVTMQDFSPSFYTCYLGEEAPGRRRGKNVSTNLLMLVP